MRERMAVPDIEQIDGLWVVAERELSFIGRTHRGMNTGRLGLRLRMHLRL